MNKFWIVMADEPRTTISYRHATLDGAKAEAFRLSRNNDGKFFFVLEVIGGVGVQPMPAHWWDIDGNDNQPVEPDIHHDNTPDIPQPDIHHDNTPGIPQPDSTAIVNPAGEIWTRYRSGGSKKRCH